MNAGLQRVLIVLVAVVLTGSGLVVIGHSGRHAEPRDAQSLVHMTEGDVDVPRTPGSHRLEPAVAAESLSLAANASDLEPRCRKADLDLRGMLQSFDERTMGAWMAGVTFAPVWTRISLMANCNEPIDEYGNRLVHIAARSGNFAALWVLMQNGADPDAMNLRNQTSLQIIRSPDRTKRDFMVACLLQHTPERIPETLAWFHAEDEQKIPARFGDFADDAPTPPASWLPVLGRIGVH